MAEMVRTDEGDLSTLRLAGTLDVRSAPDFSDLTTRMLDEQRLQITLDLTKLELIDSSGCGVIVAFIKRTRAAGGQVQLVGLSGQPRAVFKMLRLERVFPM